MGFLDDYGLTQDDVQEAGFKLAPEGRHEFTIGDAKRQNGTKNKPGEQAFVVGYQLSDADGEKTGEASERWVAKQDGKVTQRVKESLGYMEARLKQLGFENGFDDLQKLDDLVGIRGTLDIVHTVVGDRKYANVRNVQAYDVSGETQSEPDTNEYAEKAAAKRTPKESPVAGNEDLWAGK